MLKGIVAGSFDPITKGHVWLIQRAAEMVGEDGFVHVVMGVNPAKKYYFAAKQREKQIRKVLADNLPSSLFRAIVIESIGNELLINHAKSIGATHIFRGIRNTEDFNYEAQIQQVNRRISSKVETVFFIPPSELTEVSSSTVKGLVGFNGWEDIVDNYIYDSIKQDFKAKLLENKG